MELNLGVGKKRGRLVYNRADIIRNGKREKYSNLTPDPAAGQADSENEHMNGTTNVAAPIGAAAGKDALSSFINTHYLPHFEDGTLIRGLAIADSLHDFREGYRGSQRSDTNGKIEATRFLDNVTAFESVIYGGGASGNRNKEWHDKMMNLFVDGRSEIEHFAMDFFELKSDTPWIAPITRTFTTTELYRKIGTEPAKFALELRDEQVYSIEINGSEDKIKDSTDFVKRINVAKFLITFLFGDPAVDCYFTCDSGPNVVRTILEDSIQNAGELPQHNARGLMVPQNVSDSATATGRNLTSLPDFYYFPTGTDPLLTVEGHAAEITSSSAPNNSVMILPITRSDICQSVANNLTGPYGVKMYYENTGFKDDKSLFNFKQVIEVPHGDKLELIYSPSASSGASVNQLLKLQINTKTHVEGSRFPSVPGAGSAIELPEIIRENPKIIEFIKTGLNSVANPHNLYFDIKRAGDQDQCLATFLARKVLNNVVLVTGDPTCGIRNRSYDNPTIYQLGQQLRIYRSVYSGESLTNDKIAYLEFNKIKRMADIYKPIIDFYSNRANEAKITALVEKIDAIPAGDDIFYTLKKMDMAEYIESLKLPFSIDFGFGDTLAEPEKEIIDNLGKDSEAEQFSRAEKIKEIMVSANEIKNAREELWNKISFKLNEDKNLKMKDYVFMSNFVNDIHKIEFSSVAGGAGSSEITKKSVPLLNYQPKVGRKTEGDIDNLQDFFSQVLTLLNSPTPTNRIDVIDLIQSYNAELHIFTEGLFNAMKSEQIGLRYRIIIAGTEEIAKNIRCGKPIGTSAAAAAAAAAGAMHNGGARLTRRSIRTAAATTKPDPPPIDPIVAIEEDDLTSYLSDYDATVMPIIKNFINARDTLIKTGSTKINKEIFLTNLKDLMKYIYMPNGISICEPKGIDLPEISGLATDKGYQIGGDRNVSQELLQKLIERLYDFFDIVSQQVNQVITQGASGLAHKEQLVNLRNIVNSVTENNYRYVNLKINEMIAVKISGPFTPNNLEKTRLEYNELISNALEKPLEKPFDWPDLRKLFSDPRKKEERRQLYKETLNRIIQEFYRYDVAYTDSYDMDNKTDIEILNYANEIVEKFKDVLERRPDYLKKFRVSTVTSLRALLNPHIEYTTSSKNMESAMSRFKFAMENAKNAAILIVKDYEGVADLKTDYRDPKAYIQFLSSALEKPTDGTFYLYGYTYVDFVGLELALAYFYDLIMKAKIKDHISYFDYYITRSPVELDKTPFQIFNLLPRMAFVFSQNKDTLTNFESVLKLGGTRHFKKTYKKRRGTQRRKKTYGCRR